MQPYTNISLGLGPLGFTCLLLNKAKRLSNKSPEGCICEMVDCLQDSFYSSGQPQTLLLVPHFQHDRVCFSLILESVNFFPYTLRPNTFLLYAFDLEVWENPKEQKPQWKAILLHNRHFRTWQRLLQHLTGQSGRQVGGRDGGCGHMRWPLCSRCDSQHRAAGQGIIERRVAGTCPCFCYSYCSSFFKSANGSL